MYPIIDSHCHIYPDKIANRAAQSISEFYDIPVVCDGTVSRLLAEGERAGITHYLVHSVSTTPAQVRSINEFIAMQVKLSNGTMTGFGTLHPDSEDVQGDVEHLLSLGLKGVKLHPDFQKFALDSTKAINLCEKIAGKIPLLVHAGDVRYEFSNPKQLLYLMQKLPDLMVIAAHLGGWSCWESAEILSGMPNLYVDCSSSLYALEPENAKRIFYKFGIDRVLFGSDYPMWSPKEELDRLHAVGLSAEEKRKVLYDNAAKLLSL